MLTGDFEGAWADVVKIFDNTVELLKKPFMAFIDWAKNIFSNLGDYIGNVISNAASSAWNSAKSFIGLGDDEEQSLPAYSGGAGMNGIPYGNPGLNGNLAYTPGGGVSNSSVSQSNTIHINTSDPVVAGNTAANGLQQSMRDANRMNGRGGM